MPKDIPFTNVGIRLRKLRLLGGLTLMWWRVTNKDYTYE